MKIDEVHTNLIPKPLTRRHVAGHVSSQIHSGKEEPRALTQTPHRSRAPDNVNIRPRHCSNVLSLRAQALELP